MQESAWGRFEKGFEDRLMPKGELDLVGTLN